MGLEMKAENRHRRSEVDVLFPAERVSGSEVTAAAEAVVVVDDVLEADVEGAPQPLHPQPSSMQA